MDTPLQRGFVRYQLPVIVWALLIFVSSSIPGTKFPSVPIFGVDKIVHIGFYFIFCFLAHRALAHQQKFPLLFRYSYAFSVLCTLAYGAFDEFHQYFVPSRSSDVFDVMADVTGALIYVGLVKLWLRLRMNPKNSPGQNG